MKYNASSLRLPYLIIVLFLTSAFATNCARPSSPMGGPKDTIPPIVRDIDPLNYRTNSRPKEITFEFNEYMQLKDAATEVIISPTTNIRPTVEVNGKKIITKMGEDIILDSNTTYTIDYGRALQDLNEGNAAREIMYVFSTGEHIDSLTMSGLVVDASTGDTIINALVYIYEQISDTVTIDSTLYNGKVLGMYKTDSLGVFVASYLQDREYRVFAIEDGDKNWVYSPGEDKVGFLDYSVNPAKLNPFKVWYDPISREIFASPQFQIRLFSEEPFKVQEVTKLTHLQKGKIEIDFTTKNIEIDSVSIDGVDSRDLILMPDKENLKMYVWIRNLKGEVSDTLNVNFKYLGVDTLGKAAMVWYNEQVILQGAKPLTNAEKRAIKRKTQPTLWDRILMWFRFRYRAQYKRDMEQKQIEYQHLIDSIKNNPEAVAAFKRDSLRLDSIRLDSLRLDSLRLDSIEIARLDSLSKLQLTIDPSSSFNPKNRLIISSEYPLDTIIIDSIKLTKYAAEDKGEDYFDQTQAETGTAQKVATEIPFSLIADTTTLLKMEFKADWETDTEYEIEIAPKALRDIMGKSNDTIRHRFSTVQRREMTQFEIEADSVSGSYVMDIVLGENSVEYSTVVTKDSTYIIELLPVGDYKIRFTKDSNSNGKFDDGNLLKRITPEEIVFYKDDQGSNKIETKKNFDYVIKIDFSALFPPLPTKKVIEYEQ